VQFNKNIVSLPIKVRDSAARRLSGLNSTWYEIQDLIELKISSNQFDDNDAQVQIKDYYLTSISQSSMSIQIEFEAPSELS